MNKPVIGIISSEFPPNPGGIGNHAYHLALSLHSRNYKVFVLTNEPDDSIDTVLKDDVEVIRVKRRGTRTYWNRYVEARKLARKSEYLIVTGKFSIWLGYFLKVESPKAKITGVVHGTELRLSSAWERALTERSLQKLDSIIAVSAFTKSLLSKWNQVKTTIIPNGINFHRLTADSAPTSQDFFGDPVLLTVGNVTPRKGQHRVIKALPEILRIFPDTIYHIVGIPTDQKRIKELIKEKNVENSVVIHGRVSDSDLNSAYQCSDVFIMLSENQPDGDVEGFGIAILEANAKGVPALGALGCGIEDAIDGSNGLLVDGDNADEIIDALKRIIQEKHRFREGAKKWAQDHDWNLLIDSYLKVLSRF